MESGDGLGEEIFEFFISCLPIIWVVGMATLWEKKEVKKRKNKARQNMLLEKNKKKAKNKERFSDYKSIPDYELEKLGIDGISLFSEELYNIFKAFQIRYYNLNFSEVTSLCTDHYLKTIIPKMKRLKKNQEKIQSYEVRENFKLNRMIIHHSSENGYMQTVSAVFDVSFLQYVKGKDGNILGGNPYKFQRAAFDVTFQRNVQEKESNKKCLNCGAPIKSHYTACEYCLTELKNPYEWRIKSVINKIAWESYIDYYET